MSAAARGGTGAHIQLYAYTRGSPLRWRLLSGNNREIGRGVGEFKDVETCRLSVKDLQYALDDLESSVRRTMSNQWIWELSWSAAPVAVSGRPFDRRIRCRQGLRSFLLLMPDADVGATLMVSNARRWRSSSTIPAMRRSVSGWSSGAS